MSLLSRFFGHLKTSTPARPTELPVTLDASYALVLKIKCVKDALPKLKRWNQFVANLERREKEILARLEIMRPHLAAAKASLDDAHEPHLAQYLARVEFLKREIAEEEAELNEARAALTLEANTERNTKFESSLEGVAQEAASLIFGQGKKPAREQIKKVEEIIRSAL